ncbi:WXG100 family type VII secretion target [Streptomyces sp. NPDC127106]|uniref:WXG100 family type VII secretion target n=1 Tax=Streptomyces sp. NPDC127106 TaxID=3345360 RepID=UPI0036361EF1
MATNFEGFTHQQLLAMVASIDPKTVESRAAQLTEAADTIKEIGSALKKTKVTGWEGDAATAFADWASQAGSATLRLGDLSAAGGRWMAETAQTMHEVKVNMPEYDAAAAKNLQASKDFHNDPDAQKIGQEARSKLSGDHQKAVDAMTKLAGSYEQSSTQIGMIEIPTFPPPPGDFQPKGLDSHQDIDRSGGGYGGASGSTGGAYMPSSPRSSGPSGDSGGGPSRPDISLPPTTGPAPVPLPDKDVDVDLDHVAVLPDKTVPPVTSLPSLPTPGPNGPNPVVPMPPIGLPPVGGGPTLPGGGGPINKVPSIPSPPTSGSKIGGLPPLLPRDTGIVGGRQVTTGGPTHGIPRGTVIGTEGPMGSGRTGGGIGGMHPGMGGPHAGGQGGSAMGRRLAMEPGGVVGGRQPGMIGRTSTGGQPFTQGGAGLVRNEAGAGSARGAVGHAGAGVHAPGNRRDNQSGERPDYLSEDEETWRSSGRVVPPVID